jgi:hypothetical protein
MFTNYCLRFENYVFELNLSPYRKLLSIKDNCTELFIQGVSDKIFEPNISVICQRIFMKFKMQIF